MSYSISLNSLPLAIKPLHNNKYSIVYKPLNGASVIIGENPYIMPKKMYSICNNSDTKEEVKSELYISDELVVSEKESQYLSTPSQSESSNSNYCNITYNPIYKSNYEVFYLDIEDNNNSIVCSPMSKQDVCSFDLVQQWYVGICIYFDIDLPKLSTMNKTYIVYSKKIKKTECIKIKNAADYQITMDKPSYYPIYVLCCYNYHTMYEFTYLYPFLVKNIFHNDL